MKKLALLNDEVIELGKNTAIIGLNGKYGIYKKEENKCEYPYNKYEFLTTKLAAVYNKEEEKLCLIDTNGDIKCKIDNFENKEYNKVADSIAKELEIEQIRSLGRKSDYRKLIGVIREKRGKFIMVDIRVRYMYNSALFNSNGKFLCSTTDGYTFENIESGGGDYIIFNDGKNDGLFDSEGNIVFTSKSRIRCLDHKKAIYQVEDKVIKIANSKIISVIDPNKYGCKNSVYLGNGIILFFGGYSNSYVTGYSSRVLSYHNGKLLDINGNVLLEGYTVHSLVGSDLAILSNESEKSSSIGILSPKKKQIKQFDNVKCIEKVAKFKGIKVIKTDGTAQFFTEEGDTLDTLIEHLWLTNQKIRNNWLKLELYVCMNSEADWYITNELGEILVDNVFDSPFEAEQWFKERINKDAFKKPIKSYKLWVNQVQ